MASASFLISNRAIRGKSSAIPPPPAGRISARLAAFSRGSLNASLYEVLGVPSSATFQEIKLAYRKLARVLHPDVASCDGGGGDRTSSDEFMRVHAAYTTLSDPEKRAVYDGSLIRRPQCVSVSVDSGYSVVTQRWRNWETDQCW